MPYRVVPFVNDYYYHVFNRGINKQAIFSDNRDYQRFLECLRYYQISGPKPKFSSYKRFKNKSFIDNPKIVEIVSYCLMPNHFHLLLKQNQEDGIREFMSKVFNSYTRYYNTKHSGIGPLLQGVFKAVLIESNEQLIHVSRYIHLNPYVAGLVKNLEEFPYSSYGEYSNPSIKLISTPELVLNSFKNSQEYKDFIADHQDYALKVGIIKQLAIDEH